MSLLFVSVLSSWALTVRAAPFAHVAGSSDGTLSVIDAAADTVVGAVAVGRDPSVASTVTLQTATATPTMGPCGPVCLGLSQSCTAIVDGSPVSGACFIQTDHGCECGLEGPPPTSTTIPTATPTMGPCGPVCRDLSQSCTAIVDGRPVSGACFIQTDHGCECGPEGPPPTSTANPTATAPSPTPLPVLCAGDCDGTGSVTVDELILCVNIALGNLPLMACNACDTNGDGNVTVDDLLNAVNNALNGCPAPAARP
jgi:hypothetical protein